ESLLEAAAVVAGSDAAADANAAVVHPKDIRKVFKNAYGLSGETPQAELRLNIHGMAVYPSTAVDEGEALVGAWNAASKLIVGLQPTFMTDPYSQMKSNIVTVLGETAKNIAVFEPRGFAKVKF